MKNLVAGGRFRSPGIFAMAVCALFMFACRKKVVEQPSIPEDKMVRIMADLTIAEAATMNFSGMQRDSLLRIYFKQVYELHGITQEDYEKSMRIYASDVDRIERMTTQVEEIFGVDKKGVVKEN